MICSHSKHYPRVAFIAALFFICINIKKFDYKKKVAYTLKIKCFGGLNYENENEQSEVNLKGVKFNFKK